MKQQACSNLQTLELLFQGRNFAQETKKKKLQRNEETSIDLSRTQEMFDVSISRNSFQRSNNCSHIAVSRNELIFGISFASFITLTNKTN